MKSKLLKLFALLVLVGTSLKAQDALWNNLANNMFTAHGKEYSRLYLSGEYFTGLTLPRLGAATISPPRDGNRLSGAAFALGLHLNSMVSLGVGTEIFKADNPMGTNPILGFVELKVRPLIDQPKLQIHTRASMLDIYDNSGTIRTDGYYSLSVGWDWHRAVGFGGFTPAIGISYMPYHSWIEPLTNGYYWLSAQKTDYSIRYRGSAWSLFMRLTFTIN